MVGTTLGHYRVLELLGRGGMGEVYAAEDMTLRRRVAIKVLAPDMANDPERRRRFEREAQAVAALNHPGIVTVYSVERENDATFITMELLEGRTLDQAVPAGGLPIVRFLDIAIPLADALHAAHEGGILHRDLKPGNVMLTTDGRVKVLDFGLAKLADPAPTAAFNMAHGSVTTSAGQIVGTLAYMAPEQAEGRTVDHRADIFGLGVLLYELAAGMRPFAGESNVAVLTALLRDTPRPLSEMRRDLPAALAPIVQQCLEKDPAARYQSAALLREDLERLRRELPPDTARSSRRTYILAAGVVTIVAGITWWIVQPPAAATATEPLNGVPTETAVLITGRQIAILDFPNRTGDPEYGAFGRMISEALATGLTEEGLAVVGAADASAGDGVTITGAYFLDGPDLRFDVQLRSASRGVVVKVLEPIRAPRSSLLIATDQARRRVIAAVHDVLER
jgi:serine/threonine protein kinase